MNKKGQVFWEILLAFGIIIIVSFFAAGFTKIFFSDLNGEELVATLNPFSDNIEYQKPIGYNKFKYNGYVYKFDGKRIDFCVNPGHKLFVGVGNTYYKCIQPKEKRG